MPSTNKNEDDSRKTMKNVASLINEVPALQEILESVPLTIEQLLVLVATAIYHLEEECVIYESRRKVDAFMPVLDDATKMCETITEKALMYIHGKVILHHCGYDPIDEEESYQGCCPECGWNGNDVEFVRDAVLQSFVHSLFFALSSLKGEWTNANQSGRSPVLDQVNDFLERESNDKKVDPEVLRIVSTILGGDQE